MAELPRREHAERVVDSFSTDAFENLAAIGGRVELTDNHNRICERNARAPEAVDSMVRESDWLEMHYDHKKGQCVAVTCGLTT